MRLLPVFSKLDTLLFQGYLQQLYGMHGNSQAQNGPLPEKGDDKVRKTCILVRVSRKPLLLIESTTCNLNARNH